MGKAARTKAREEKKKAKQRKKDSERLKYEGWKLAGTNSKSKRFVMRNRRVRSVSGKHEHRMVNCGNVGCKQCFPRGNVLHDEIARRVLLHVQANAHVM